mgnify:CR=1 FL=1
MENLNDLYQWLIEQGVLIFERQLPFTQDNCHALTIHLNVQNTWGIFVDKDRLITAAAEKSAVLHESGHYATGATHSISSPIDLVEKHEYSADKWAIQRAFSAEELDLAVAEGYTTLWDLADYFGVTEDFMRKAVCWYTHGNLAADLYF